MSMAPSSDAVITGLGLASSVGTAVGGAAAIRAGIARPREGGLAVPDDGPEPLPVTCHPAHGIPAGSHFVGRWIHLASAALRDLQSFTALHSLQAAGWGRTGLIAAVPDELERRYSEPDAIDDSYLIDRFLIRLAATLGFPMERRSLRSCRMGHAGAIGALRLAIQSLRERELDRVIVLGCDSHVDPGSLDWLQRTGRVKTPDRPVGLAPGEAAACFLLESRTAAAARTTRVMSTVMSAVVGHGTVDLESGRGLGEVHAQVTSAALRDARTQLPFEGLVYCDLNGTAHRAYDHGDWRMRLGRTLGDRVRIETPCGVVGDTGAASGALAVVLATRALQRGYATGSTVLVTSRSEGGHVAATCLGRTPGDENWR